MKETRTGGSRQLKQRVAEALQACYESIGTIPTATKYNEWRNALPEQEKKAVPSLTSVVPIAFETWREARDAAGIASIKDAPVAHGPEPLWTADECVEVVRQWLQVTESNQTFAGYNIWVTEQRALGARIPSVSTVRLRLRKPWSEIVALAEQQNPGAP